MGIKFHFQPSITLSQCRKYATSLLLVSGRASSALVQVSGVHLSRGYLVSFGVRATTSVLIVLCFVEFVRAKVYASAASVRSAESMVKMEYARKSLDGFCDFCRSC
jgi:hypothetical protein